MLHNKPPSESATSNQAHSQHGAKKNQTQKNQQEKSKSKEDDIRPNQPIKEKLKEQKADIVPNTTVKEPDSNDNSSTKKQLNHLSKKSTRISDLKPGWQPGAQKFVNAVAKEVSDLANPPMLM